MLLAGLVALALAAPAEAGPRVRLDAGPTWEFTNLVYRASTPIYVTSLYDTTLSDTIVVFRDSLAVSSSPEAAAGVFARLAFGDTIGPERYYWLEPELRVARALVTGHVNGAFRWSGSRGLVLGFDQRFEHSLDQRFGLSRRYDSEVLTGELGARTSDRSWSADFRPRLQVDRTDGSSGNYFQDSNGARLELDAAHLAGGGGLLDLQAYLGTRAYPDSTLRDYNEALAGFRWDTPVAGPLRSTLAGEAGRRGGPHGDLRHDLFSHRRGEAELLFQPDPWSLRGRVDGERYDYRSPDSVFFDSRLARAELGAGRSAGPLDLELRPRFEWLTAPGMDTEDYRQFSLLLTVTRAAGGLADLSLEAGRRHYLSPQGATPSATAAIQGTHSDYHLYGVSLLLNQPLGPHVLLEGSLDYQVEAHDHPADDNHIVFASLQFSYGLRLGRR